MIQEESEKESKEKLSPKVMRMLDIYTELISGYIVKKDEIAKRYGKSIRTIERDIKDLEYYMENNSMMIGSGKIIRKNNQYNLEQKSNVLSNSEILAVCKILLDSRAFPKEQMSKILHCFINYCAEDKKQIKELIRREETFYVETHHEYEFMGKMWEIGDAITHKKYIEVDYKRVTNNKESQVKKRKLKPIAILFWEYYFYLVAFREDKDMKEGDEYAPIVYRIDRMRTLNVLEERFHIPDKVFEYDTHVNEGEFRKRVQFMRGGKLRRVKFLYYGDDIHGVCDRLPTAKITSEENGIYKVKAEVFGDGIDMWFKMHQHDVKEIR